MTSHALLALGVLVGMLLTVGVGVDAHNRGRSWVLWGMLTFFTGLVGAVIYGLVVLAGGDSSGGGDDADTVRYCPNCSTTHPGTPNFCSDCGEPLDADDDRPVATILRSGSRGYCRNCTSAVGLDADTCPNCGAVF